MAFPFVSGVNGSMKRTLSGGTGEGQTGSGMRRIFMVALAAALMVAGLLMSPLPIPFPLGLVTFLLGCAILLAHSKSSRRFVQYLRHRNDWLSRAIDYGTYRAPAKTRSILHKTRPHALRRQARLRARKRD
jgi:hypothetical protein